MSEQPKTVFNVADMSCNHCVGTIKSALESEMPGVDFEIDLGAHTVSVAGDKAKAEAVIRDAGYTPEVVK
ncbi:heavy-metal-associated domain-containing protein [Rhizobium sp. L1K21]|uniref:heavy-metal-associated domain-containing protein n=1 Tax=Rhizobium sp. L1K21 TaxID=2954933 RepID=UPI002093AA2D|nr:heavy metal-associated domain-containing protein [Rhizobium sp. L1K21]MCO6186773.1 heavy-metal-associated domain-containing protein [Rhizobium sp. L1K21]